eukprot:3338350-Rhodomonas_salina.1
MLSPVTAAQGGFASGQEQPAQRSCTTDALTGKAVPAEIFALADYRLHTWWNHITRNDQMGEEGSDGEEAREEEAQRSGAAPSPERSTSLALFWA